MPAEGGGEAHATAHAGVHICSSKHTMQAALPVLPSPLAPKSFTSRLAS